MEMMNAQRKHALVQVFYSFFVICQTFSYKETVEIKASRQKDFTPTYSPCITKFWINLVSLACSHVHLTQNIIASYW